MKCDKCNKEIDELKSYIHIVLSDVHNRKCSASTSFLNYHHSCGDILKKIFSRDQKNDEIWEKLQS